MTIGGAAAVIVRQINKLLKRLNDLESWTNNQQDDIEHSKDERVMMLSGLLACLYGLKEQGCNGAVTKNIAELEDFIMKEAHRGKSVKQGGR